LLAIRQAHRLRCFVALIQEIPSPALFFRDESRRQRFVEENASCCD